MTTANKGMKMNNEKRGEVATSSNVRIAAQLLLDVLERGNVNAVFSAASVLRSTLAAPVPPAAQAVVAWINSGQVVSLEGHHLGGYVGTGRAIPDSWIPLSVAAPALAPADLTDAITTAMISARCAYEDHAEALECLDYFQAVVDCHEPKLTTTTNPTPADLTDAQKASPVLPAAQAVAHMTGKELYLSRYEHEGGIWASNEHQDVWNDWADRLNARTSISAPAPADLTDEQIMKMFSDVCAIGNWPRAATRRNLITFGRTLLSARSQS